MLTESGNLAVYDTGDQLISTFTLVAQGEGLKPPRLVL